MALPGGLGVPTVFGAAMLLIGGFVLAVSARYVWRATTVVRATELDRLEDADAGTLVRASGSVTGSDGGVLAAPFSGADCVALRYRIEERRLSVFYLLPWYVDLHGATAAVPFEVETATGAVPVVEPARTVALTTDVVATVGFDEAPPERIRDFVREHLDVPPTSAWRDPPGILRPLFRVLSLGTRRYSEQRAALGDELTVVGRVTPDGAGIDPLVVADRSPAGTVLRMAKTSIGGLLVGLAGLLVGALLLVGA
jgi:hypothetical protein